MIEIVNKILEEFPVAINDVDLEQKNAVLLAIENKHYHVYRYLRAKYWNNIRERERLFGQVDKDGNTVLRLAAGVKWLGSEYEGRSHIMQVRRGFILYSVNIQFPSY